MKIIDDRIKAALRAQKWRRLFWGCVSGGALVTASYLMSAGMRGPTILGVAAFAWVWMLACGWAWWREHKIVLVLCVAIWAAICGWLLPSGRGPNVVAAAEQLISSVGR